MPLDLNVANSIIQAFSQGKSDRLNKEKFSQQQKEHADALKFQMDQAKQQHDLEQEKLAQAHEIATKRFEMDQVEADLRKLMMGAQIGERYSKGLGAPANTRVEQSSPYTKPRAEEPQQAQGFIQGAIPQDTENQVNVTAPVGTAPVPINMPIPGMNSIPEGQVELEHPLLGKIRTSTPEAYAAQQGKMTELEQAPLEARKIREQAAAQKEISEREVANISAKNQFEAEKTKYETEAKQELAEKEMLNKIQLEHIKGGYRMQSAKLNTEKLTPAQKDKAADFNDLESKVNEVKQIFESTPNGYENYYKGGLIGGIRNQSSKLIAPSARFGAKGELSTEDVRQKLAAIELMAKNLVGKLGGALTPNEQKLLEQLAPSPGFEVTADRGKSRVNGFLMGIQNSKAEMAKSQGKPEDSKKPTRIKVDANGNEIP